jgi:uncharacterized repeat protein (TIGR03809 family)
LFETGRWRRFHSERTLLENIQEAKAAVETWRDLSSREASRNNRAIDMSWLGRIAMAVPRDEIRRDPVHPQQPVEISAEPLESLIVPQDVVVCVKEALSAQAINDKATRPMQELTSIAERYPSLRHTL